MGEGKGKKVILESSRQYVFFVIEASFQIKTLLLEESAKGWITNEHDGDSREKKKGSEEVLRGWGSLK